MASNYKETHKINIKGILNIEENKIELEDGGFANLNEVFKKFNGAEITLAISLTNELD